MMLNKVLGFFSKSRLITFSSPQVYNKVIGVKVDLSASVLKKPPAFLS